jgi:hypothetical protein
MSGAVVLPDRQVERVEAGDHVDIPVAIHVVGDHADELVARRTIDRRRETGGEDDSGVGAKRWIEHGRQVATRPRAARLESPEQGGEQQQAAAHGGAEAARHECPFDP